MAKAKSISDPPDGFKRGLTVEHIMLSIDVISDKTSAGQFDDSCANAVKNTLHTYQGVQFVIADVIYKHTKIEHHADACECFYCKAKGLTKKPI